MGEKKIYNIGFWCGMFWPKNPYLELKIYNYLKNNKNYNIELIFYENDLRINPLKNNKSLFTFDYKKYKKETKYITIKNEEELINITKKYDLLLLSLFLRNNLRHNFYEVLSCKTAIFDYNAHDILKWGMNADYIFSKSIIFSEFLKNMGCNKNKIYTTGSPEFDSYLYNDDFKISKEKFYEKYNLNNNHITILLLPSNLKFRHKELNTQNLDLFDEFYKKNTNINYLIKTYPNDYKFYEVNENEQRTGYSRDYPDYIYFKKRYPNIKIINIEDSYNVMKYSDKIINFSGSTISYELFKFCKNIPYAINYNKQPYYCTFRYYPEHVRLPDDILNIHIESFDDILKINSKEIYKNIKNKKFKVKDKEFTLKDIISKKYSLIEISDSIDKILLIK